MKKVFSFLAVLAFVFMASSSVWADDPVKSAVAFFGSAPELTIDVTVHSFGSGVADYATVAEKTGERSGIVEFNIPEGFVFASSTTQRVVGKDFLKVHTNIAAQSAGHIEIMTNNTKAGSAYQAKSKRRADFGGQGWEVHQMLANGLVRKNSTTTYQEGDFAPITTITVSVSSATTNFASAYPTATQFDLETWEGCRPLLDSADEFLEGSTTTEYVNYQKNIGMSGSQTGGLWINGGWSNEANANICNYTLEDVVIFFAADFTKVTSGAEYGTDQITFMSFAE